MTILPRLTHTEYHFLPEFSLENITAENARIDKTEIHFPLQTMLARSAEELNIYIGNITADNEMLFRRSYRGAGIESRKPKYWLLTIPPTGMRNSLNNNCTHRFTIKLDINFSRFYQSNADRIQNIASHFPTELFQPSGWLKRARQICISNQNDNILLGSAWRDTANVRSLYSLMLNRAASLIEIFMPIPRGGDHAEVSSVLNSHGLPEAFNILAPAFPRLNWNGWVIKHNQVYWDFQCEDAISFVWGMEHPLRQITAIDNAQQYPVPNAGRNNNSLSHSFPLANDLMLTVYAKTQRRVRFEITFLTSPRNSLNRQIPNEPIMRSGELSALPHMIQFQIETATTTLQRIVRALTPETTTYPRSSIIIFADLMNIMHRATGGNILLSYEILPLLMRNERIVSNSRIANALMTLERAGVLQRVQHEVRIRKGRRYVLTPKFQPLLRAITASESNT